MNKEYYEAIEQAKMSCFDLKERGSGALGETWDELQNELFTPKEIAASNLRAALMGELIKVRQERGLSQKKLEELSGVKQPIIARMEKGYTSPQLDTLLKVLAPMGKTLAIVPINVSEQGAT